jgi:hypothetical protein
MPTAVVASVTVLDRTLETPKSPNLSRPPADTKMFCNLRSLAYASSEQQQQN